MARLVSCPHCAAPFRIVGVESRFRCDYCRTLVELSWPVVDEELVVSVELPDPAAVRRRARRWLRRQDVVGARVDAGSPCYAPFWHVVSHEGEEATLPAADLGPLFGGSFVLPAAPLRPREEPDTPSPSPCIEIAVDAAEAERAALATFQDRSPAVERRRLIWVPIVPVRVVGARWMNEAWFLPGPQRFVAGPFPREARHAPADPLRLTAFGCFALLALAVGWTVDGLLPRLVTEASLLGAAWLAWRLRFSTAAEAS